MLVFGKCVSGESKYCQRFHDDPVVNSTIVYDFQSEDYQL